MTSPTPTLYDALGAEGGIRDAVDAFYARVVADPELAGYFAGIDMPRLRRHQVDMLGHLGATLASAGAEDDSIGAVVAALAPLRSSIVSA